MKGVAKEVILDPKWAAWGRMAEFCWGFPPSDAYTHVNRMEGAVHHATPHFDWGWALMEEL